MQCSLWTSWAHFLPGPQPANCLRAQNDLGPLTLSLSFRTVNAHNLQGSIQVSPHSPPNSPLYHRLPSLQLRGPPYKRIFDPLVMSQNNLPFPPEYKYYLSLPFFSLPTYDNLAREYGPAIISFCHAMSLTIAQPRVWQGKN